MQVPAPAPAPAPAQKPATSIASDDPHAAVTGRRSQVLSRLFGPLTQEMLAELETEIEWRTIAGGETLLHQGDPADALYVVIAGRLRTAAESPNSEGRSPVDAGPGEIVGEAALLGGGRHRASVDAVRDGDLARIPRRAIDRLSTRFPRVGLRLSAILAGRLDGRDSESVAEPTTIAVVAAGPGVPLARFGRQLERSLTAHGDVTRLDGRGAEAALDDLRLLHWLDARERDGGVVIYQADPGASPWTDRCVRQADHVLIVADADADPVPGEVEQRMAAAFARGRAPRRSLVLLQRRQPRGTARWRALRDVEHYHVRIGSGADFDRLARYLTGTAVGLVLGGGGARGAAHIGVLRALEDAGSPVDMVGGTSMGAILAGLCALDKDSREVLDLCRRCFDSLLDYTLPTVALLRGRKIAEACTAVFGDRDVEDLWLPFYAVSTHLDRGEQVVHRRGNVVEALRASSALPGILPPVRVHGDLLVDGGLLNNVPADVMRELVGSRGTVVASDVSQGLSAGPNVRAAGRAAGRRAPGLVGLLRRARRVGAVAARRRMKREADLYLELPLAEWKLLDFDRLEAIFARGHELAEPVVTAWRDLRQPSAARGTPGRRLDGGAGSSPRVEPIASRNRLPVVSTSLRPRRSYPRAAPRVRIAGVRTPA